MRIVSLLPSATEIVTALGLHDQLVGVTHECDYPASVRELPKVTRTLIPTDATSAAIDRQVKDRLGTRRALYTLDEATLERLRPELIVTQALCDVCAVAEAEVRETACRLPGAPRVLNLEPETLAGVFAAIGQVARETDRERAGRELVTSLQARVEAVRTRSATLADLPRVALLEWLDPPFSCGHWNPELVRLAGGVECLGREGQPSRRLRWQDVVDARPDVVLVACCGFDVQRTLRDIPAMPALPARRIHVTDGAQYFSRPGPRLVDSLEILAHTLHPELHRLPADLPRPVQV